MSGEDKKFGGFLFWILENDDVTWKRCFPAGGTTFSDVNNFARQTGTTHGVPNVI